MGPLLFALFCEDLQEWVPGAKIVQFADDVTLITSDRDPERAVQKMNEALEQFERYAAGNWLAPEPTKTQVLYCTGVDKGKIKTKCEMAAQELEVTEATKILGSTSMKGYPAKNIVQRRPARRQRQRRR